MSRDINHPDVRAIVRALDRAECSDRIHPGGGAVRTTAALILEWGHSCDRFNMSNCDAWAPEAARAVVIAFALHAPETELRWMADTARREIKNADRWDRLGWYEAEGEKPSRNEAKRVRAALVQWRESQVQ